MFRWKCVALVAGKTAFGTAEGQPSLTEGQLAKGAITERRVASRGCAAVVRGRDELKNSARPNRSQNTTRKRHVQTDSNAASLGVANSTVISYGRRRQQAYRDAQSSLPGAHKRKRIFSVLEVVDNSDTVSSPKY